MTRLLTASVSICTARARRPALARPERKVSNGLRKCYRLFWPHRCRRPGPGYRPGAPRAAPRVVALGQEQKRIQNAAGAGEHAGTETGYSLFERNHTLGPAGRRAGV